MSMNRFPVIGLSGLSLLIAAAPTFAQPAATQPADALALYAAQQKVFRAVAERIASSVVTIHTIGGTQPLTEGRPATGPGERRRAPDPSFIVADGPTTGLVWSSDGLILTSAFNFVREPSVITVVLPDGRRFVAELLGRDEIRQLAMLRIEVPGLATPQWLESLGELQVGRWAIALGRGFGGPSCSISAGIISGLNRQAGLAIQTDAKLSPANFGGPLVDVAGRVIGLCVPMGMGTGRMAGVELYDSGIGFAIPYAQVQESAKDLAAGRNIRRGMLGIAVDGSERTIRVSGIGEPSPALRAGMQVGDVIITIDGITVQDYPSMQRVLRSRRAGQRITVRVRRGGEELELTMPLAVPEDLGPIPRRATRPADEEDVPETAPQGDE